MCAHAHMRACAHDVHIHTHTHTHTHKQNVHPLTITLYI